MIEIIAIVDPKAKPKAIKKKSKLHRVKAFLADHFAKKQFYNLTTHSEKSKKTEPTPKIQPEPVVKVAKKIIPKSVPLTTKKHDLKPQASYSLNIDPLQPVKPKPKPQQKAPTLEKKVSTYNPMTERIWNFLQLVSTAAVLFSLAFAFMNWSAYSVILEKRVNDLLGLTDTATLDRLAADREIEQNLLASGSAKTKKIIPPLSLDVTPPDTRILIPRINQNVPVIPVSPRNLVNRDWSALEKDIQEALRAGVVHYPGTAMPGEDGNVVITGHSSYFPWDPGRFKDVFALLHDLKVKDRIVVYSDQKKYIYEVSNIKVILPEQVEVLNQKGEQRLTLLTCTPVGTNLKRLVIEAVPI